MADLTTLASVKAWLNITSSASDALLGDLITSASKYLETRINRTVLSTTYVDTRDGHGGVRMLAHEYPITAVSSVTVDGVAVPASVALSPGYVWNDISITLLGQYSFRRGLSNVVLQYSAGYPTVPYDIEQAVIEAVGLKYKERERVGVQSKSVGGETVSFFPSDFTKSGRMTMQQYEKVIPV